MGITSTKRSLEPTWLPVRCVNTRKLSRVFLSHLLDRGSTTRRMSRKPTYQFSVTVRYHNWGKLEVSEAKALHVDYRTRVVVREVDLYCNNEMWMFARTVIPEKSLVGKNATLRKPINFALGKILFGDPQLKRSEFELAVLKPGHREYNKCVINLKNPPEELWGRRSVFWLNQKPLLMTEVWVPHPVLYEE